MNAAKILSMVAIGLTLAGVGILTLLDTRVTSVDFISRLNEADAPFQAAANGVFLLLGIFWMGAVDTTRRLMEPTSLDSALRFSAIAFAASYLLSMLFPCDVGCPPSGSMNQLIHNSLVWVLYSGPAVFAARLLILTQSRQSKSLALVLILLFVVMQFDSIIWHIAPGLWQRSYELLFCWLWWRFLTNPVES